MHTVDHPPPARQRGPHNDPSMLDGDSAHGNPGEPAGDEWAVDTDTDVVDATPADELEEVIDGHTPDSEAEADEEGADDGVVNTFDDRDDEGAGVVEEVEVTDETDLGADAPEDAEDADIDSEGDARGPEPDETTLEVELDRQMHRGTTPLPATGGPPIPDYLSLTVPQVLERVAGLDAVQVVAVLEFERANKNRKTLVTRLAKLAGQ